MGTYSLRCLFPKTCQHPPLLGEAGAAACQAADNLAVTLVRTDPPGERESVCAGSRVCICVCVTGLYPEARARYQQSAAEVLPGVLTFVCLCPGQEVRTWGGDFQSGLGSPQGPTGRHTLSRPRTVPAPGDKCVEQGAPGLARTAVLTLECALMSPGGRAGFTGL